MFIAMSVGLLLCGLTIQTSAATGPQPRIEGTINDSLGRPVAGAEVRLKTADGRVAASATTNEAGKFVLQAAPGTFELTVTKPEFKPAAMSVTVAIGNPIKPIILTM